MRTRTIFGTGVKMCVKLINNIYNKTIVVLFYAAHDLHFHGGQLILQGQYAVKC